MSMECLATESIKVTDAYTWCL